MAIKNVPIGYCPKIGRKGQLGRGERGGVKTD